ASRVVGADDPAAGRKDARLEHAGKLNGFRWLRRNAEGGVTRLGDAGGGAQVAHDQLVAGGPRGVGRVVGQPEARGGQRGDERRRLPLGGDDGGERPGGGDGRRGPLGVVEVDDQRVGRPAPDLVEDVAAVGGDHDLDAGARRRGEEVVGAV